jgi:hypothetical protein
MNHTFATNVLIVLCVLVVAVLCQNPLALLALCLLQEESSGPSMPRFITMGGGGEDDDESKPIGFTADIR